MSNAIPGPGFKLQCNSTGSYVTIAEVRDINGPEMSVDIVEVTNQDSPDNFEEIIPTLKKGGTSSFDVNFVPTDATQTDMLAFLNARTVHGFQILVGPTKSVQFQAYCVKWSMKFPIANVATASVDLRVTGPVVIGNALV